MERAYYSDRETADILGLSRGTVRSLRIRGDLDFAMEGSRVLITRASVERYIAAKNAEAEQRAEERARGIYRAPEPALPRIHSIRRKQDKAAFIAANRLEVKQRKAMSNTADAAIAGNGARSTQDKKKPRRTG